MNANLRKEIRIVMPIVSVAAIVMWMAVSVWKSPPDKGMIFACFAFLAACLLVAIRPFCAEFQHRTMTLLLVQPISRTDLWRTKRRVQLVSLILLVVALFIAMTIWAPNYGVFARLLGEILQTIRHNPENSIPALVILPLAFLTGPFWALLVRGTLAAAVFALAGPFLAVVPVLVWAEYTRPENSAPVEVPGKLFISLLVYALTCWVFSRRHFLRMQLADSASGEIDVVGRMFQWFDRTKAESERSRQSAGWALFKKELLLQQVPSMLAVLLLVGWGGMLLSDQFSQQGFTNPNLTVNFDKYAGALGIYFFLVPFLSGCIALTEERASGIHAWQITLPVSRRRQWQIKLAGLASANIVLGFLIPGMLLVLFPALREHFELNDKNPDLLIRLVGIYMGFLLISVYVASLSRNTMQAVVAAVIVVGAVPTSFVAYLAADPFFLGSVQPGHLWILIWVLPAIMVPPLLYLSQRNFTEAEVSNRQRIRQAFLLFSLLAVVVFGMTGLIYDSFS